MTSATFTKPIRNSGGCVEFYYHMHGSDMGTLKVQVYDVKRFGAGPVKEWSKSGNF